MSTRRALTLLYAAFWLRLLLVPLSFYVAQQLDGTYGAALAALPVGVTVLCLAGFSLLGRGDARSALFAQLTAAVIATEVLFDLVMLCAPQRLAHLPVVYLVEVIALAMLVGSWATLSALARELGTELPAALRAFFCFTVAVRAGLYGARASLSMHDGIDMHRIDMQSALALVVALTLPLLEAIAVGTVRRGSDGAC